MTSEHASDEQLQQYALDRTTMRAHIDTCTHCQQKAAFYIQLITAIEVQPLPMPAFDISDIVLAQIETKRSNWRIYLAIAAAVLPIGIGVYYFRVQLFAGTSIFFISLMAITAVCIVIAMAIDQVKTYRHKMNILATQ